MKLITFITADREFTYGIPRSVDISDGSNPRIIDIMEKFGERFQKEHPDEVVEEIAFDEVETELPL